jgi:hypothetical protein
MQNNDDRFIFAAKPFVWDELKKSDVLIDGMRGLLKELRSAWQLRRLWQGQYARCACQRVGVVLRILHHAEARRSGAENPLDGVLGGGQDGRHLWG